MFLELSSRYKRKDKKNMDENLRNAIALFRYGTLAPLITGQTEFKDPWTYFRSLEGKKFESMEHIEPSVHLLLTDGISFIRKKALMA